MAIKVTVNPMTDQSDLPPSADSHEQPAAMDSSAPAEQAVEPSTAAGAEEGSAEGTAAPAGAPPPPDAQTGRKKGRRGAVATIPLVLFSCLFLMTAVIVDWAHYTVINTEGFVNTVGPVIESDAVTANIATQVTNELVARIDLQSRVHSALPSVAKPLAAPITGAVESYIQQAVTNVLRSPRLHDLWYSIIQFTHSQVIAALKGDSQVIQTTGGEVVLNTLPFINQALQSVQSATSDLLGHNVHFPTITSATLPETARAELSSALGVNLPSDFGQITLFRSSRIKTASNAVTLFGVAAWVLPILALLALLAAIWLSRRRRRTLLQFLFLAAILIVLLRRFVFLLQRELISSAQPANQAAASDIIHQLTSGLVDLTTWILGGLALAIIIALVTGPYRWATSLRGHVSSAWTETGETFGELSGGRGGPAISWITRHRALLQVVGAVVGLVLMLVLDFAGALIVLLLLAVYELVLWRLHGGDQAPLVEAKG
jgi:hypothetical protein